MISNKLFWVLSGIIGAVFLVIIASLGFADKIQMNTIIIFIIVVLLLVFIVDMSFWFIRKGQKIKVENEGKIVKVITLEEARKIAKTILMSTQYSEYERERPFESVWGMGDGNTPVYVRVSIGEFDNQYIGICINMEDSKRRSSKEFTKTMELNNVLEDLKREANLVATKPKAIPSEEEEIIERPGERVTRKRHIHKERVPEEKKDGGLK